MDASDREFLKSVGVPVPPADFDPEAALASLEPKEPAAMTDEQWGRAQEFLDRTGEYRPKEVQTMNATPGNSGPISREEAYTVARALRRLPRDVALEVLAERRRKVGPQRFAQEARAIVRAAGEHDAELAGRGRPVVGAGDRIDNFLGIPQRVPTAAESDPVYQEALRRSGVGNSDSRFRRQYGRQP